MKSIAIALLSLAISTPALADQDAPSPFSLSGFGTIGAVRTDKANRAFRSSSTQESGATTHFDSSVDSVIGVQGTFALEQQLSLTVQTVVRKEVHDSYSPRLTWGFLRFQATPELALRAGRTRTPFFMYSDSVNLNYANPWVRPPVEVYTLNPFADLDGIDALYRTSIGHTDLEIHAYGGESKLRIGEGSGRLRAIRGIKGALSTPELTVQVSYARSHIGLEWGGAAFTAIAQGLQASGNEQVLNQISGRDGRTSFLSAGFQYDKDRFLLLGEYVQRNANRYTSNSMGWYLTGGYRINTLTPYITFARQHEMETDNPAATGIASLDQSLRLFNGLRNKAQRSLSVGMRWDVARHIALKSQLERVQPGPNGLGVFQPADFRDNANPGGPVHVLTFTADFVF